MAAQPEVWNDITDRFDFVEQTLVYVDAPLEGHLRAKSGELFAFRCTSIVDGALWHWVLMPVDSIEVTAADACARARQDPALSWLSIVEDRRSEPRRLAAVWMTGQHRIPRPPSSEPRSDD